MTRKRLGAIDPKSVSIMRNVAENAVAERRGQAVAKAPPIGQVASTTAQTIEDELLRLRRENDGLQNDAKAFGAAQADGLMIARIALDKVDEHALSRDRRKLDQTGEPWDELIDSLRARGQQTPIEVTGPDPDSGMYRLVSGYRRLTALRALFDETSDSAFSTVKAIVTIRPDTVDAMVAMVEENEIRQDVSFYERGRICCLAAEQGVFGSVDEAIQTLFANSSRNRRYKIRNFALIHTQIGPYLDFPEQIGERLGARLAQALKEGRARELVAVSTDRGERFADAADELAVLEAFAGQKGAFAADRPKPAAALQAEWNRADGVKAKATARAGRVTVELRGISLEDEAALQALLERIAGTLESG